MKSFMDVVWSARPAGLTVVTTWSYTHTTHNVLPNIHTYFYLYYISLSKYAFTNTHELSSMIPPWPLYTISFFYKIGIKSCWRMLLENTWIVWTDQMTCEPLPLKTVLLWNEGQQCFFFWFFVFSHLCCGGEMAMLWSKNNAFKATWETIIL